MCLYPFAWTNVFSAKYTCFAIWARVDTKFLNSSHHVLSMDDRPGDATFFLCGASLWRSSTSIWPKKGPSPLDFYFWHLRLGLLKSLFWLVEAEHMCLYPFARTNVFSAENKCFGIWARIDTKFLNSSHHVLSMDDRPGDATFFLCGASLWRSSTSIWPKKGPAPWILFLTPAPRPLQVTFFWLVKLNICGCTLLQGQMYFQQNTRVLQFGRALTQNSWIHPIMSYLWMIGLVMRLFSCGANLWRSSTSIWPKKGPAPWILFLTPAPRPLEVTFLVGEAEHMCLYPFAWTNVFSAKYTCFAIWARVDTKFLNSSHHVLSMDDRPGDATFFLRGQPLKIIHKYSAKKGRAAWILFLTPAPRPLEVTFLVGEAEHMWLYSFAKSCKEPYPSNNHGTFFPGVWRAYMF